MDQIAPVAQLIRENISSFSTWSDLALASWVGFAIARRRMVSVYSSDRTIVGVGAARCVSDTTDVDDWYAHDELGDTIFIDLVVGPRVMPVLWQAMKQRYGKRKLVSFDRADREGRRTFQFDRLETRLNHGKEPTTA